MLISEENGVAERSLGVTWLRLVKKKREKADSSQTG
jgi:hypothetical protein